MNQNLSICQYYTWIHWPAAQQACPEGSRATPGRSNVSFLMLSRRSTASPVLADFEEHCSDSDHTEADSTALNYRHSWVACHGPSAPVSLRRYLVFYLCVRACVFVSVELIYCPNLTVLLAEKVSKFPRDYFSCLFDKVKNKNIRQSISLGGQTKKQSKNKVLNSRPIINAESAPRAFKLYCY